MIQANELRLGNFFLNPKNELEEVEGLLNSMQGEFVNPLMDYSIELLGGYAKEDCNPIPLTPEILEKCGAFKSHHEFYELINDNFNITWDEETGIDIAFVDIDIATSLPHIQYLHQLQNLYFAIAGIELEINL